MSTPPTHYMKQWGATSLASAALLGWVIALHRMDPSALKKVGIKSPNRVMQLHLDQVMMGTILLSSACAFPDLPSYIAKPLTVGTMLNPLGFVPLMFWPESDKTLAYRVGITFSFISSTVGFVGMALWAVQGSVPAAGQVLRVLGKEL